MATNTTVPRLIEQQVTSSITSRTHPVAWDGVSPIRASLCWTDPTGSSTTSSNSRTTRLANNLQNYSLLISGSGYPAPAPVSVTPDFAVEGTAALAITGTNFRSGVTIELVRVDSPAVQAAVTNVSWTNIVCSLDVTSTSSHTPSNSYTASGPATRNTDNLLSPTGVIPISADRIRVHFWHKYVTEAYDGCVLELSPDNGTTWYQVGAPGSGTSFVRGGYTSTILGRLVLAQNRAELVGWPAWTGNSGGSFSEVVLALNTAIGKACCFDCIFGHCENPKYRCFQ